MLPNELPAKAEGAEHIERLGYTIADLSKALGVSKRTILCALDRGELRAKKLGRNWMISRKEVEKWFTS